MTLPIDQQVQAQRCTQQETFVLDGDQRLTPDSQATFVEFIRQRLFVHTLEQTWSTQCPVHLDGGAYDVSTDLVLVNTSASPLLCRTELDSDGVSLSAPWLCLLYDFAFISEHAWETPLSLSSLKVASALREAGRRESPRVTALHTRHGIS